MRASLPALIGTPISRRSAGGRHGEKPPCVHRGACAYQDGDDLTLTVRGNAFLYNMVRIIAGTLIGIGEGKLDGSCFTRALETGDRLALGVTAPARGLELTKIDYE